MREKSRMERIYARAKDGTGKEYVCRMDAVKNLHKVGEEELEFCIDKEALSPRFVV